MGYLWSLAKVTPTGSFVRKSSQNAFSSVLGSYCRSHTRVAGLIWRGFSGLVGCRCWLFLWCLLWLIQVLSTSWRGVAHTTNSSLCMLFNMCILTRILHIHFVMICRDKHLERLHFNISEDRLQHQKCFFDGFLDRVGNWCNKHMPYLLQESQVDGAPTIKKSSTSRSLRCCTPFRRGGVVPWSVSCGMESWLYGMNVSGP